MVASEFETLAKIDHNKLVCGATENFGLDSDGEDAPNAVARDHRNVGRVHLNRHAKVGVVR